MEFGDGTVLKAVDSAGCRIYGESGDEVILFCPYHSNHRTPSAEINKETGVFYCFACQKHASLVDLICHVSGINYFEALRLIDKYKSPTSVVDMVNEKLIAKDIYKPFDITTLNKLEFNLVQSNRGQGYLSSRGISVMASQDYRLGYSSNLDMVTFPYFDPSGSFIMGFQGRSVDGKEFKNSTGTKKSKSLFGIHLHKWDSEVFCTESPIDSILLHQHGLPAISTMGANPSQDQIKLMTKYFNKVYVVADNDSVGRASAFKTCEKLSGRGIMVTPPNGYKDIGEMPNKEIPQWAEKVKNPIGIFNKGE